MTFDTVLLDHYWLPDSVVWLNKGYMVSRERLVVHGHSWIYLYELRERIFVPLATSSAALEERPFSSFSGL